MLNPFFWEKYKKNIINSSSAEFAHRMIKVKDELTMLLSECLGYLLSHILNYTTSFYKHVLISTVTGTMK